MTTHQARASAILSDYANIRTIPAILRVAFAIASLYQFDGSTYMSTYDTGPVRFTRRK